MKKVFKIIFVVFVLIVILGCATYIDHVYVKSRNTYPRIAIKKKINDNLMVYNALFYRVWYCNTNKKYTLGDYEDVDAVCPRKYTYKDGYYINSSDVKISKKDLEMIQGIYTSEMIENFGSSRDVKDAVYVAKTYGEKVYKPMINDSGEEVKTITGYTLVTFPNFELNEKGNYEWIYNSDEKYCINNNGEIAPYLNYACTMFKKIVFDEKWCNLYTTSTLIYDSSSSKLCEE